jgi:hypothetical protein
MFLYSNGLTYVLTVSRFARFFHIRNANQRNVFVQFVVSVETDIDEGLYNLRFHNCPNYRDGSPVVLNFMVSVG